MTFSAASPPTVVLPWVRFNTEYYSVTLQRATQHYGFTFDFEKPIGELGPFEQDLLYYGVNSDVFKRHFPETPPPATVAKGFFEGVVTNLKRRYTEGVSEAFLKAKNEDLFSQQVCPDCAGVRLKAESRQVTIEGQKYHRAFQNAPGRIMHLVTGA